MKEIYVINGYPGCGKTTFGQMVGESLQSHDINFLHASSIFPIKHLLMPRNQWDPSIFDPTQWDPIESIKLQVVNKDWDGITKDVYWRGIMSDFKLALLKAMPNFINEYLGKQIDSLQEPAIMFVDIREPENIESLKQYLQTYYPQVSFAAVLVKSDTIADFNNYSDGSVERYKYDIVVENYRQNNSDSFACLKKSIDNFCQSILSKVNNQH